MDAWVTFAKTSRKEKSDAPKFILLVMKNGRCPTR